MNTRRLIGYLLLNALVSATVTLAVLWFWDRNQAPAMPPPAPQATSVVGGPTSPAPQINPTAPPAPTSAAPTQTTYVVQAGDTLGSIAVQFNLAIEDIMAANAITNPDVLSPGQVLIIPVPGSPVTLPTEVPVITAAPPLPTATTDPNQPAPQLEIREVRAPGVLANETLIIVNLGGPVDLAGWVIRDETGRQYTFPALRLFTNGAVNLHTTTGTDTVTDMYWNQAEAVWAAGRAVQLLDTAGNIHARFVVP
jgi:LysM repeat protein